MLPLLQAYIELPDPHGMLVRALMDDDTDEGAFNAFLDLLEEEGEDMHTLGTYGVGDVVAIRTITMYYVGRIKKIDAVFLTLEPPCGWVAHTGRWHEFLESGEIREFERHRKDTVINKFSIVDAIGWDHEVPLENR